ncbi:MAG TPA: hypothetical protein GX513_11300, partial [Firmicutes bacterium]|nr:hypothetical protein [Bacillota bacterium]
AGLLNGEMAAAYVQPEARPAMEEVMRAAGCSPDDAIASGQLLWLDPAYARSRYGTGTREEVSAFYGELCRRAEDGGWACLRFLGQGDLIVAEAGWDRLLAIEHMVTEVTLTLPMIVLCEYGFIPEPDMRARLVAAHPFVLLSACNWVESSRV